jgi:2-oxoglutarate ferredoxin oxidoreductase subunit alpha
MSNHLKLLQGNEACTEGAIYAGARFYAGYPITPSTEIAEISARRMPEMGGKFIQMEDEIAGMAAVIGASVSGVKSFTATSGPGFSLKQENLGYAIMTEIPCVVINVQRMGPSTGVATAPAQGDVMQARWGTHGDHPAIVFSPSSVKECFELAVTAFNVSETLRHPVILLLDEVIGHMREIIPIPAPGELQVVDRAKPAADEMYLPYGGDGDVPLFSGFGDGHSYNITGLAHDESGFPTTNGKTVEKLLDRLHAKIENNRDQLTITEELFTEDAELIIFTYGCAARSARQAVKMARAEGLRVGFFRTATIWPFPEHHIVELAKRVKTFLVPEMNMGQLVWEVQRAAEGQAAVKGVNRYDGEMITPEEILRAIREAM